MALGHLGHVAPGHFVRMAGASMATRRACFGSFGSWFFDNPNDLKAWPCAPCWREVFGSFGSFGHRFKIGGRSGVGVAIQFTKGIPLYQNLLFS